MRAPIMKTTNSPSISAVMRSVMIVAMLMCRIGEVGKGRGRKSSTFTEGSEVDARGEADGWRLVPCRALFDGSAHVVAQRRVDRDVGLEVQRADLEDPVTTMRLRVEAADDCSAAKNRQREISEAPLRLRRV